MPLSEGTQKKKHILGETEKAKNFRETKLNLGRASIFKV